MPTVIVGSATLLGTGGLVGWVAARPGLSTTTVGAAAAPTTVAAVGANEAGLREIQARTIRAVDRQLAAEVVQLKSLDKDLATLATRQAAARASRSAVQASAASQSSSAGSGGGSRYGAPSSGTGQSAPPSGRSSGSSSAAPMSIPSVAPIAIPAAPAALPAPPVAATTGGSHPHP